MLFLYLCQLLIGTFQLQVIEDLIQIGLSALGMIYYNWIQGLFNNRIRPQYLF